MKNQPFLKRLQFALDGITATFKSERSFQTQLVLGVAANGFLLILQPGFIWSAIVLLITSLVLASELFNTAIERIIDHLHPEAHPSIKLAKDCTAGAVLVFSVAALGILFFLIADRFIFRWQKSLLTCYFVPFSKESCSVRAGKYLDQRMQYQVP